MSRGSLEWVLQSHRELGPGGGGGGSCHPPVTPGWGLPCSGGRAKGALAVRVDGLGLDRVRAGRRHGDQGISEAFHQLLVLKIYCFLQPQ